jgi:2-polyprenyl-3-methyl-5-hydroxy-6-metoxy-1,4-benzoquinol methylase
MGKTDYEWIAAGEEWSEPWGSSAAQWFGTILPRIHECLPASTILEIAPGFGRWTNYLKEHCEQLHVVDPDERCIETCRRRFGADSHLSYHVNDGRSLAMIPDGSLDFVFSFDSLVHVQRDVVEAYLRQLPAKLKNDGIAFIHHSNLGEYALPVVERLPARVRKLLTKVKLLESDHQRNPKMTAESFGVLCAEHGLKCICQEIINWRSRRLIDCFSTVTRVGSKWDGPARVFRNPDFMREAQLIRRWSRFYPISDRDCVARNH